MNNSEEEQRSKNEKNKGRQTKKDASGKQNALSSKKNVTNNGCGKKTKGKGTRIRTT